MSLPAVRSDPLHLVGLQLGPSWNGSSGPRGVDLVPR